MSIKITENIEKVISGLIHKHMTMENLCTIKFFTTNHLNNIVDYNGYLKIGEEIHMMIGNRFYATLLYAREGILLNDRDQHVLKEICRISTGVSVFEQVGFDVSSHESIGKYVMDHWVEKLK